MAKALKRPHPVTLICPFCYLKFDLTIGPEAGVTECPGCTGDVKVEEYKKPEDPEE